MSDLERQARASISYAPGEIDFLPQLNSTERTTSLFSNIRCMTKWRKSNKKRFKPLEIYKFADKIDLLLMIFGSLAAIGIGACYPVMFFIYEKVLNYFVDLSYSQRNTTTTNNCITSNNKTVTDFNLIISSYIVLGFVSMFLCWFAWICWSLAAERQVRRMRYLLFRNILRQDMAWFDVHTVGELSTRLIDDLDRIKDGMSDKVPDFIVLFSRMISTLIYSLSIGWKLTLVYLSISPLIILTFNLSIKMISKYSRKEIQAFASASAVAQEVLKNIRTVTTFHGQGKEEDRFAKNLIEAKRTGIKKGVYVGLCQGLNTVFTFIAFAIIVWYGPYLVRTECWNYSAGSVVVVFLACMTSTRSISQFIPDILNFIEAEGSGTYVFEIIERKTNIDASSDDGDKAESIIGHIEFRNVTFTFPSRQGTTILNKLSFEIPSGKTVALIGASGCGKSTIIQLIQRFYDPDHGVILLDGKDLKSLNVAWLRSHIGIVSQEPVLFTGSIEENIRMGKSDATDEEVQNVAKMANAHDFIMALPDNYKTACGDKLSGGQKQRVAIARALISNPKILLLDEATSALDNQSEKLVQDALDKAKEGRTTIIIAHRLSTIRNVDFIIGLEHGEIVEFGSHDELMEKKGLYYGLITVQKNKEKESDSQSESDEEDDLADAEQTNQRFDRRFSKQSAFSAGSVDDSGNVVNLASSMHSSCEKNWFQTPFVWKIAKYNIPEWRWILLGIAVSVAYGTTQPFFGLVFSNIYGSFSATDQSEQESLTRLYVMISFFIGIGGGLCQFLSSLSFAKSGEALTMRMRKLTFNSILKQNIAYFDQPANSTGALITRLSSDASALKGLTGVRIGIILQGISATITGLVIGFFSSWKLTLVILCFSPIMLLAGKFRGHKEGKGSKSTVKQSFIEQGGQYASEAIENIRTVVSLHQENHFINRYEHAFNQQFKKETYMMHLSALGVALSNSVMYFVHCTCFGYGRQLVENGEIEYVQMYRVFSVVTLAIFAVGRCMAMIPDYSKAKNAALRIMQLHGQSSLINPYDGSGIILDNVVGDIEFVDIDFRYPSRTSVRTLKHFSLKCSHSKTTALVGPSGSGKSTIIALLQRFYDPVKGKILLDGHDLKLLNLRWLRSLMGLVEQEPVLFNLSIRNNIAYGDNSREVTQEEIESAARTANIHDLIVSLPQGYETLCGAKGSQLSGGQKQRIAIARALIRNPKILLLDEATSALDNKIEEVIQKALKEARAGSTCLTIAHRLTTIENADKIAVVNRGRMTEEGTHTQLLRRNGVYARLALKQKKSTVI